MCTVRSRVHMCMHRYTHTDTRKGFTTHYRACVYRRALCQVGKPILKRHRIFIPRCAESVPIRVYTVCCVLTTPVIVPLGIWTTGVFSMHLGRPIGNHMDVRERSMSVGKEILLISQREREGSHVCILQTRYYIANNSDTVNLKLIETLYAIFFFVK